ncbi:DUF4271 domain-containing protein [Flavobacterium urocaniciphilum]|uniref:DUF4271 domain-containing protein n=1 Tax=Flavobacterium urocaniciphilum TaxID=1299341 RepID=A0A1H9BHL5_9FLAO|nr:DUF4271 domain-containing protein [Flavobacterium urocaniciphilum]SEP88113.1 protein of unknown function [Flavobacterium urocaniciphilum]
MITLQLSERVLVNKDWATVLFVLAIALIAINKSVFSVRFNEFIKLGYSDKYNKVYKDTNNLLNWFTISMFFIQLISFSFFILLLLSFFNYTQTDNYITYIQIVTFLFVFVLSKFLIEKIVGTAIDSESLVDQFNLIKTNYRAFLGFILLPVNIVLYYNQTPIKEVFYVILFVFLMYNVFTYYFLVKTYQKMIIGKLFYFILYLCTLEIAPYYFMYYWVTKN